MFSYVVTTLVLVAACNGQTDSNAAVARNAVCQTRNGYHKVDASCDAYIECVDYTASDMMCPDGLHFNPDAQWPNYPCGYPMDVPCVGRGVSQPAQPTADCPHQYGYFPASNPENCGQYRMCVAGQAVDMVCPAGLAFNPDTSRCDWPDLVPSCNAEEFLGFACPAPPVDAHGNLIDIIINYKYEGNCFYFFACEKGHPRLLSCDPGLAFDAASGRCVEADLINCQQAVMDAAGSSA